MEYAEVDSRQEIETLAHRIAELEAMQSRPSQHLPGQELPEQNWLYRLTKKFWFFGFGAYG